MKMSARDLHNKFGRLIFYKYNFNLQYFDQMDIEIAKRKQQQRRRQLQLKRKINVDNEAKMNESLENLAKNKEVISVLNQELFTLRMEFQLQQTGVNPIKFQKRAVKLKEYFCNCFIMSPSEQVIVSCCYQNLSRWMRVKDEQDFREKYLQVVQNENNLQYCNRECFHMAAKDFSETCNRCGDCQGCISCCAQFTCFYGFGYLCCLCPMLCYWGCMKIANGCYKKDNRISKIRTCYEKYIKFTSMSFDV